ncbi:hypothetical protein HPP92_015132 [Vanilla planifolia]|uniref:Uncharacterized protein n=1 Tax=Vanilla planifolia TaxID=51239 RepID=A0A835QI98_VANPL|nr:hypothetical protein HPP92_015638 [Vanilla planifolia]KAG0475446.1 hypothetical protein HPP92_015132 [Vanilla planifolia]
MRLETSTFHCPLYCFSKPASRPPFQPCTSKSEGSHCRSSPSSVVEEKLCDSKVEKDENGADKEKKEIFLKSSLRKTTTTGSKEMAKECVKWMDNLGKELAEIREFEPVEPDDLDGENGYPTCGCTIL